MKTYYIWIATFEENDFEQYWDNESYENELKLFKEGLGAKPDSSLKCGFCKETGLEELDEKDFWFCFRASLCNVRELAKDYISDLDEFEVVCNEKAMLTVVIPVSACNPVRLCEKAFFGKLKTEGKDFADYIYSKYNIKVLKKPKVIIYSSGEIDKSKRVEILSAGESDVKSNEIIEAANTDISRSEDFKVYAFNNVRIYIPKSFAPCYMDRLKALLSM